MTESEKEDHLLVNFRTASNGIFQTLRKTALFNQLDNNFSADFLFTPTTRNHNQETIMRYAARLRASFVVLITSFFFSSCTTPDEQGSELLAPHSTDQTHPSGLTQEELEAVRELIATHWDTNPDKVWVGRERASVEDISFRLEPYIAAIRDAKPDSAAPSDTLLGKTQQRRYYFDCIIWWCADIRSVDADRSSNIRVFVSTPALIEYVDSAIATWNNSGSKVHFKRVESGPYDTKVYATSVPLCHYLGDLPAYDSIAEATCEELLNYEDIFDRWGCGSSGLIYTTGSEACTDFPYAGKPGDFVQIWQGWTSWSHDRKIKVVTHALGHVIGLAHTDYSEDLTRHIPGTPDKTDASSIMNFEYVPGQHFTYWDMMAVRILYPLNIHRDRTFLADVNDDGRSDLIIVADNGISVALNHYGELQQPRHVAAEFTREQGWMEPNRPLHFVDVNGDGIIDILGFGPHNVTVAISTGSVGFTTSVWHNDFGASDGFTSHQWYPRMVADVNADNALDIIGFDYSGVVVALQIPGTSSFGPKTSWNTSCGINDGVSSGWVRTIVDVTGDGRSDLICIDDYFVKVHPSTGTSFANGQIWNYHYAMSNGWAASGRHRTFADVTGDGKADLIAINGNQVFVEPSTGYAFSGFSGGGLWSSAFDAYGVTDWSGAGIGILAFSEVTGDGIRKDLIRMNTANIKVLQSTGTSLSGPQSGIWHTGGGYTAMLFGDLGGDGGAYDLVALGPKKWFVSHSTGSSFQRDSLLYRTD